VSEDFDGGSFADVIAAVVTLAEHGSQLPLLGDDTDGWRHVLACVDRLRDPNFLIAVCGEFSSGKSVLLGALMRRPELFPDGVGATTTVPRAVGGNRAHPRQDTGSLRQVPTTKQAPPELAVDQLASRDRRIRHRAPDHHLRGAVTEVAGRHDCLATSGCIRWRWPCGCCASTRRATSCAIRVRGRYGRCYYRMPCPSLLTWTGRRDPAPICCRTPRGCWTEPQPTCTPYTINRGASTPVLRIPTPRYPRRKHRLLWPAVVPAVSRGPHYRPNLSDQIVVCNAGFGSPEAAEDPLRCDEIEGIGSLANGAKLHKIWLLLTDPPISVRKHHDCTDPPRKRKEFRTLALTADEQTSVIPRLGAKMKCNIKIPL
jgi:hypothetical protein